MLKALWNRLRDRKSAKTPTRPLPAWPEIVASMHDDAPFLPENSTVVRLIYSADQEWRAILWENTRGHFYQYRFERLVALDEDEWAYNCPNPNALPGFWTGNSLGLSLFGTEQEAWNDLTSAPEYRNHFVD